MAFAIGGLFLATPFGVARAEEGAEAQKLTITKQAYWSRSLGHVAPKALTDHFPPTVVCLVAPQFCNSPLAPALAEGDKIAQQTQPESIPGGDATAEAMAGGKENLPTGVLAGARRYLSAIQFDTPAIPTGHRATKFEIQLTPDPDFTFHYDSPAFRQTVLSVLRLIQSEDPEAFMTELEKVGNERHPPKSETLLGVEACPIVGDFAWDAGGNQDAAKAPERDTDERKDGAVFPKQVDCSLGSNAKHRDGKWVFDLTLAVNAWADGKIPNNGLLLRPVLPPNLAYGDPDLSTFDQAVFFSPTGTTISDNLPTFSLATKEKSKPVTLASGRTIQPQVLGAQATSETFTETFGALDDPAPVLDAADPAPAVDAPPQRGATLPAGLGVPVTEWWVWLLLPMFLAGVYLTTQALTAEPAMVTVQRSGAMTRLIEARRRGELT
ncbi:MAG TPA: hypothetical protein VI916_09820 [Acidimicrobiia bacterium]|nr:hypothetical protein [Acidimicrobiia bacterium]